ncbi:hypothetical protein GQ53DRAFT_854790 [Thozetella sp. PMI_491]|nr:hypothetical protein GQ53DRAFT_854790 [Thozetella sp. PMI_491]
MASDNGLADASPLIVADAFFARHGIPPATGARCWGFLKERYPADEIRKSPSQGYCSLTFCVGHDTIVQFRPPAHQLDIRLAQRVTGVYGDLAPKTQCIGTLDYGDTVDGRSEDAGPARSMLVYSMARIPGVSLADHRRARAHVPQGDSTSGERITLIRAYAKLLARSWHSRRAADDSELPSLRGKVGSSLRWRVEMMQRQLPARFHPYTSRVLEDLGQVEGLPWVLTHGDVVPSNIMVLPAGDGLQLTGLLDWAEAEYLPFGVGLYGAEELLGQTVAPWNGEGPYPPPGSQFAFFDDASRLREAIWRELEDAIPELRTDGRFRTAVQAARDLGILLWHGIAFDDGRLDRVVQEGRDDEEIQKLDLFLRGLIGNGVTGVRVYFV